MQYANVVFYGDNVDKIVEDKIYQKSNTYTYNNANEYKIKKGDIVLVRVNMNGYSIAKIIDVFDESEYENKSGFADIGSTKSIIGLVDVGNIQTKYKIERKLEEMDRLIEQKYKQMNKLMLLEQVAKSDESFNQLLSEYKELLMKK